MEVCKYRISFRKIKDKVFEGKEYLLIVIASFKRKK